MSVRHHFIKTPQIIGWDTDFSTVNTILRTPYEPLVLILGTYNPNTPNNQGSDFFYHRNYFWSTIKNLFTHNGVIETQRRDDGNTVSLKEIFEFCRNLKLTFADLIIEVLHNNNPNYHLVGNTAYFEGVAYDLIKDNALQALNLQGQVNWNTMNIVKYLRDNPSVEFIYFTRQPAGIRGMQWNQIRNDLQLQGRDFKCIFTPSGLGDPRPIPRTLSISNSWTNNDPARPHFDQLDTAWLIQNGVEPDNFLL